MHEVDPPQMLLNVKGRRHYRRSCRLEFLLAIDFVNEQLD